MRAVHFRGATPADRPALESLLRSARLPLEGVAEALPHFVVAESEGALVAAAALEPYGRAGLLRSVAVAEGWQRNGLGAAIVQQALALARQQGIEDVYLLTITAEEWFPRFGFTRIERAQAPEPVRQSVEFVSACPASAVVMHLALAPAAP